MKKVLAIKTPVGGIVQIIPREDSETAVSLFWIKTILSEVEKEASRLYLFDEGFIEHAIGALEPDMEIERFLREICDRIYKACFTKTPKRRYVSLLDFLTSGGIR